MELDHEAGQALQNSEEKEEKKTQSQIIIGLTSDMVFVHDEQGEAYAKLKNGDHYELWAVKSRKMNLILMDRYMNQFDDRVPSENSLREAISALEAKAILRGEKVSIHTRIAETDDAIYIDLCNDNWEVVEIKKDGWKITSEPPVYFKRSDIMQPLPNPIENGNIEDLKPFINYDNDNDYKLIIAWLLSTLKENNPFPLLTVQGEQGSAKSTTTKVLRALIDPSSLPLRALPNDEQTLAISANNTWILAYDNLSGLSVPMSDSLCKMSTGGGLSVRELYTTREESVFNIMRPTILNGIDDIAQRPDLLDRSIVINLPSISEENRKDEKTFWNKFEDKKASVLGALCDVVSSGLNELPHTTLEKRPRMADFAIWVTACEKSLGWQDGEFMEIYNQNRDKAIGQGIESDPFATAVVRLIKEYEEFEGTPSKLVNMTKKYVDESTTRSRAWPKSQSVRNRLRRINPSLRNLGINYIEVASAKHRTLRIEKTLKKSTPSTPVTPSLSYQGLQGADIGADNSSGADKSTPSADRLETSTPYKAYHTNNGADGADGADKNNKTFNEGNEILI